MLFCPFCGHLYLTRKWAEHKKNFGKIFVAKKSGLLAIFDQQKWAEKWVKNIY
jgi:hypothetical protein